MYRYRMLKSITEDDRKNMLQGIERNETYNKFHGQKNEDKKGERGENTRSQEII